VTLYELHEHIRRVIALNYREPIWVTAEVAQASMSRGHLYLDLITQTDKQEITAYASALVWAHDLARIYAEHNRNTVQRVLSEGAALRCQVKVDFHERYGLKLQIVDIDPTYTLGLLAQQRLQDLATLTQKGLLRLNGAIPLPLVCQRIAVVSSSEAAGYQDFIDQLRHNPFEYTYRCTPFWVAVQGQTAPSAIVAALAAIGQQKEAFDVVVIVRGGGARMDLAAFDALEVAESIARCPIPVLVGVGHQTDQSLADLVAHTSLKTPTAVADYVVQRSGEYEQMLLRLGERLRQIGQLSLQNEQKLLESTTLALQQAASWHTRSAHAWLDRTAVELLRLARQSIQRADLYLVQAATICAAWHPDATLRRGFTITLRDGQIVRRKDQVSAGDTLTTRFADGDIESDVT
jgi:exodeoxyribonuclease VII large subunit